MIPINKIGKIIDGEYAGWEMTVTQLGDQYSVPYWSNELDIGYDDYYLSYNDLEESMPDYHVEWTDEDYFSRLLPEKREELEEIINRAKKSSK